jgi:hypothetical protein
VVEMQYAADLADPLLDVRDVVESFRSYHVTPPDWDETLRHAIAALSRLQALAQVNVLPAGLLPDLNLLLTDGLDVTIRKYCGSRPGIHGLTWADAPSGHTISEYLRRRLP